MPVSRVSGLGFYDTRTVTGLGFVDESYTDTTTYVQLSGFSATTSIGTVTATTDSPLLSSLSATVSLGTITAIGGATNVPVTGVSATTAIGIAELVTPMTNIKIGSVTPTEIHVGGTRIYKAYAGPNLVWYQSQRATQYRGSTSTTGTSTYAPHPVNTYWRRYLLAFTYTAAELASFDIVNGSVISKLRWYVSNPPPSSRNPMPNYAIRMLHIGSGTNTTNPTSLGGLSSSNVTDVKAQHNYDFDTPGVGYHEMALDNNFAYKGSDAIGFIFAWGQVPTGYIADGAGYRISSGTLHYNRTDSSGTYAVSDTASRTYSNYRPVIEMFTT